MKVRALAVMLATALVPAGSMSAARSAEAQACPAEILAPLNTGFANPRTAPNPFEGDWCGFWDGSPSALRIRRTGARTAVVVTTFMSGDQVHVSHDRATIRGTTLSFRTPRRGRQQYTITGQTLEATLHNSKGTFRATFNRAN